MGWCEDNGVDYIFGLAGNAALHALAYKTADDLKVRAPRPGRSGCAASPVSITPPARAKRERHVVARFEATTRGFDARYIVTSHTGRANSRLYEGTY